MGVPNLSTSATTKAVTKEELARHCRRRTRGMEEMTQLIEELLLSMSHATDTLVYSSSERRPKRYGRSSRSMFRVSSILQVSPSTPSQATSKKAVSLYQCCAVLKALLHWSPSTSIWQDFIPGSSAGDINYQAYLLEGIVKWNAARAAAANPDTLIQSQNLSSFDICLKERVCLIPRD